MLAAAFILQLLHWLPAAVALAVFLLRPGVRGLLPAVSATHFEPEATIARAQYLDSDLPIILVSELCPPALCEQPQTTPWESLAGAAEVARDAQGREFLLRRPRDTAGAEHDSDPRPLATSFRGPVPGAPDPETFAERHRVFAVMLRGVAIELPVPP